MAVTLWPPSLASCAAKWPAAGAVAGVGVQADPGSLQGPERGDRGDREAGALGRGHLRRPCRRHGGLRHGVLRETAAALPLIVH